MLSEKEMVKKDVRLIDVINIMKYYSSLGLECYLSGRGDGSFIVTLKEEAITFK